jgi:hypothetical protein
MCVCVSYRLVCCVYVTVCVCVCVSWCLSVCSYVHLHRLSIVFVCMCVCVCVYVYMCVYMCLCVSAYGLLSLYHPPLSPLRVYVLGCVRDFLVMWAFRTCRENDHHSGNGYSCKYHSTDCGGDGLCVRALQHARGVHVRRWQVRGAGQLSHKQLQVDKICTGALTRQNA